MLTKDQKFLLEVINHIQDPQIQKSYLTKLQESFEASSFVAESSKANNTYDLTTIL